VTASANRRFRLNILANGFSRLNLTLIQLVGVPLFLLFWGVDLYGEWLLLATIPVYLNLGDLGLKGVAQNDMSILVSAGDRAGALRVFQAALVFLVLIFVFGAAVLALALWFLPFEKWLGFSVLDHTAAWLVLAWMFVKIAANQIVGLLLGVFRAEGRNAQGIAQFNFGVLAQFVVVITAIALGVSPIGAAALDAVISALLLVIFWRFGRRLWPSLGVSGAMNAMGEIRRLMRPSLAYLGCTISQALILQGSTTLVGVMLGPQAVVLFNTMRTLTRIPQQAVEMVANSLGPEISLAHGRSDLVTMRRLYRQAIALNIWSAGAVCLVLTVVGHPFYVFWTQGEVIWDQSLFLGVLAVVCVSALYHSSMVVVLATNKSAMIALPMLIGALATLGIAVPLTEKLGLIGMVLALVLDGVLRIAVTTRAMKIIQEEKISSVVFYVCVSFWTDAVGYLKRRIRRFQA
jgi:O-antigen/teichoic acid export membrane protein